MTSVLYYMLKGIGLMILVVLALGIIYSVMFLPLVLAADANKTEYLWWYTPHLLLFLYATGKEFS